MEIYEQSNCKILISFFKGILSIETKGLSGILYNKNDINFREQRPFILSEHYFLDGLFTFNMKAFEKYLVLKYGELSKQGIELRLFFETVSDIIVVDGIKDFRHSSSIRIVFVDPFNESYMDEIIVYKFCVSGVIDEIEMAIRNYGRIISKKKSFLGNEKWYGIPLTLSSKAAGYFIHEIVGHMLEEDAFNLAPHFFDDINISSKLSVIDKVDGFENLIRINRIDDVGNRVKTLQLITNGKLNNAIAISKGNSFDGKLYGMARRESYLKDVMPRMRGTFILERESMNQDQIIDKYQETVFIDKIYMGECFLMTGEFTLRGDGFLIRNGEIQNIISNVMIRGTIKKYLENIDHIGNDFKAHVCECGKLFDMVRVAIGSPTVSILDSNVEGMLYGCK